MGSCMKLVCGFAAMIAACGGDPGTNDPTTIQGPSRSTQGIDEPSSQAEGTAIPDTKKPPPPPIASLRAANGNMVRFYVADLAGIVTEEGKAGVSPATAKIPAEMRTTAHFVDTWTLLAPDQPVPAALVEAEQQLKEGIPPQGLPPPANPYAKSRRPHKGETGGESQVMPMDLYGCNNGCCDPNWTYSNFWMCHAGDWHYYLFNYGYSWASASPVWTFDTMICSAIGTSYYEVWAGSYEWAWWVSEATYLTVGWYAPDCGYPWVCFISADFYAFANDPFNQHLHTHCGSVWFN